MSAIRELAERALRLWGHDAQRAQVIEECAEAITSLGKLIVAINHRERGRIAGAELADEIADVEFMLEQLCIMVCRTTGDPEVMTDARARKRAKVRAKIEASERKRGWS